MKKEYLIGLLTGCLLTASALMFMGATDNESGKYAITTTSLGSDGSWAFETIMDTKTGEVISRKQLSRKYYKKEKK